MAAGIAGVLGDDLQKAVIDSKVLVVGAGGIGCEVLKNLVLTGFKDIEIIDLDTIDVSNLNRQFLFHKQHVGKSKAHVARESALKFNPNVNIRAYHDSIISKEYGLNYFKQFSVVLNALDNRAARNHVNRMCLSSGVPLVESGTAGYEGQVELIVKGRTKCYECYPKTPQKSFPGCTIRNTPSEPIHCIVWAKHLFNQLFGEEDSDQEVSPDTEDPEAVGAAGDRAMETEANKEGNVKRVSTRGWAHSCHYDPQKLFAKLFHDDIEYLLSMHDLWKTRQKPTPLSWTDIPDSDAGSSESKSNDSNKIVAPGLKDQRTWSIKECVNYFANSCKSLSVQLKEKQKLSPDDHLVWDKDDKDAMDFVAACANIRAHIFKIQQKSLFEIKSMAGNIIPAIATTNAIVAGLVVLFVMNVLRKKLESCPCVYVRGKPNHRNQQVVPEKLLNPPNTKCYVCSAKPEVSVGVNVETMTVLEFVEQVLKKSLNMVEPDVTMVRTGSIVISSDEEELEENASKTLAECGVDDGCILEVDDFVQDYKLTVNITNRVAPREGPEFVVAADPEQLKPTASKDNGVHESEPNDKDNNGAACDKSDDEESDDDLIMTFGDQEVVVASDRSLKKRKAPEGNVPVKKRKTDPDVVSNSNNDEDITIVE